MKVWLLHMESYGDVSVHAEHADVTAIPFVKGELNYLNEGGDDFMDEYYEFISDVKRVKARGRGEAGIEERFRLELVEVKS